MQPNLILGIETSTPHGGVALAVADPQGARLVSQRWLYCKTGYSRRLMPTIDASIKESGFAKENIAAIGVTRGPGSFTGVRIGLVTAKTLAHALGVPLYLFCTLEALARRWPAPVAAVCAVLDARRNEIYSGLYQSPGAEPAAQTRVLRAPHVEPCENLLNAIEREHPGLGEIWFTGDGAEQYWNLIAERLGPRARMVPAPWNRPAADIAALMAADRLARSEPGVDPFQAVPDYLRGSDAERNLAGKKG